MKYTAILLLVCLPACAQQTTKGFTTNAKTPDEKRMWAEVEAQVKVNDQRRQSATSYTHCVFDGSSSNDPKFTDEVEYYKCDQGELSIRGHWSMSIENGYVYDTTMGRAPDRDPYRATPSFVRLYKWCPTPGNPRVVDLCGWAKEKP